MYFGRNIWFRKKKEKKRNELKCCMVRLFFYRRRDCKIKEKIKTAVNRSGQEGISYECYLLFLKIAL